jgi:hypothetical protein
VSTTTKKSGDSFTWLFVAIAFAVLLQVFHIYISAPIKPGHAVAPGIWLSKCGLLAALPSCENAYFALDKTGKVTVRDQDQEIVWEMQGSVCDETSEESCQPGMQVSETGTVTIGGRAVLGVFTHKKGGVVELSPWPFAEPPKLKVWKK